MAVPRHIPLKDLDRDGLIERLHRRGDKMEALHAQIEGLQKKVVDERSGRRKANRRADAAEAKLRAICEAIGMTKDMIKKIEEETNS